MEKKGKAQANIIAVVLIILIVIVAVIIIVNVVVPLVREKSQEVNVNRFSINLEINSVKLFPNSAVWVDVKRNSGAGSIDGLRFVFYDGSGNSKIVDEVGINELETKTYQFSPLGINVDKVSVFPVIGNNLGMESQAEASNILEVPKGVVSWWSFDGNANDLLNKNNCQLISGTTDGVLKGVMDCGNDPSLDINDNMAISFWINTSYDELVIKKGANYEVVINDGFVNFSYAGETNSSDDRVNLKDGKWHHVVVGSMGIYVDSLPHKSFSLSGGSINNQNFTIGEIKGELDEVIFFNESLGSPEVVGLYNNQKNQFL